MKDPIDKFRFDEDSDTGRSRPRYHGNKLVPSITPPYNSLDRTPTSSLAAKITPSPGGGRVFTEHVPNYTDTDMDYLDTQDLAPLRGHYVLSSPSSQDASSHTTSYQNRDSSQCLPYTEYKQADKPEDYDSGYPITYGFSDQDQNSNLLSTSPHKNLKDKNVYSSREHNSDASQSYSSRENILDVSKSASSGDSRNEYLNGGVSNGRVYSEGTMAIMPGSHPQALKYARERNLREARDNLRYRSSSLGETSGSSRNLNGGLNKDAITKARTPSAPGDLSHRGRGGYYGNREEPVIGSSSGYISGGNVLPAGRNPNSFRLERNHSSGPLGDQGRMSRIDTLGNSRQAHSIMSGEYRVHDHHNKSIISATSTVRLEDGSGSLNRPSAMVHKTLNSGSYNSVPLLTHRKLTDSAMQPNGAAKLLRDKPTPDHQHQHPLHNTSNKSVGLKSLNSSKDSLSTGSLPSDYNGGVNSLVSLALLALLSLVICVIALQLLFRLTARAVGGTLLPPATSSVLTNTSYGSVLEVTVALAAFVVMLDLSCLLVCSMQCFFAAKLLKCSRGEQRCYKYLKECAGTRFIAVTGFFISIPALLLALLLYILMEFSATPAIVSTVILTVGLTFAAITIVHSVYFWRVEKTKADLNLPPYSTRKTAPPKGTGLSQSELSTLV